VAKVRLGMIGCGGIAQWHMSLLEKMEEAQMVAFCDIREEAARECAEKYSGVPYTKHEEMFAKEKLDAIFLCIPPFAHTDQAIMAAQKGIHVFAEKPVALNMAKALEIQRALDTSGVVAGFADGVSVEMSGTVDGFAAGESVDTSDVVAGFAGGQTRGRPPRSRTAMAAAFR